MMREIRRGSKGRIDFLGLSEAIPLGNQEDLEAALNLANGVLQVLCITLPRSQPRTMIKGLRAMAGSKQDELLSRLGRAPTLDELLQANVKGAARLWYRMPWSILGPLVQEHGTALRAALLKRTELSMEELRGCLIDHPLRFKHTVHASRRETAAALGNLRRAHAALLPALRLREILKEATRLTS